MVLSAIWATGLSGYGGLPAVLAESCVFQLAARFNGACSGSFLPFLWGETYALRRDGCSRGLGGGLAFGDVGSGFGCQLGSFSLMETCVACVSGLEEREGELEGTTYCTRVRAPTVSTNRIPPEENTAPLPGVSRDQFEQDDRVSVV